MNGSMKNGCSAAPEWRMAQPEIVVFLLHFKRKRMPFYVYARLYNPLWEK